ncbi:uncharacterized protein [Watersipora subatra]|uniref:uncharacterized protein n=1 Tax=Watersipora subatra TaxID=2589382 RepID=UPI00355AEC8B
MASKNFVDAVIIELLAFVRRLNQIVNAEFHGGQPTTVDASTQTEAIVERPIRPLQEVVPLADPRLVRVPPFRLAQRPVGRGARLLRYLEEQARSPAPRALPAGEESSDDEMDSVSSIECGPACLAWPCDLTRCTCFGKVSACIDLTTGAPTADATSEDTWGMVTAGVGAIITRLTVPTTSPDAFTDPTLRQASGWPSHFVMGKAVTPDLPVVVGAVSPY